MIKNKGGYRPGSGRKCGTGKYGEKTIPMRIPIGLVPFIKNILSKYIKKEINAKEFEKRLNHTLSSN